MFLQRIVLSLAVALGLCGICCPREPDRSSPQVVRVSVESSLDGAFLHREYTESPKMEAVLNYLRAIQILPPPMDAGGPPTGACRFTLTLSNGEQRVYFQRSNRYLRKDGGPWQTVDPSPAPDLRTLLEQTPSDG